MYSPKSLVVLSLNAAFPQENLAPLCVGPNRAFISCNGGVEKELKFDKGLDRFRAVSQQLAINRDDKDFMLIKWEFGEAWSFSRVDSLMVRPCDLSNATFGVLTDGPWEVQLKTRNIGFEANLLNGELTHTHQSFVRIRGYGSGKFTIHSGELVQVWFAKPGSL